MAAEKPDIQAIFNDAIALGSESDRMQYLDQACGEDLGVRARVEALLNAHSEAGGFFGGKSSDVVIAQVLPFTEAPGTVIGPYKLLQQIGEGGMGVVYMAEQQEPVRRKVALKIIKPGMDTRQVIARFEAERQALSLMDHPNIAKVLDAGATESGRPYFVMELVKGQPITEYCDQQHLTPRERLKLLLPVCQAIQHAHQKGIIHRDIKPSNILVAEYDQHAVPKVIDFGVAKAVSQPLTEKTMFTGFGQIVGTLEYMSPEQAKVNQLDIDTRSDIYSLGVLMYELLAGSTPFDRERLRSAAWDEMLRIIREEEPPRPSTKLSSSESLASVSANRSMEPARLSRTVRGELDWIVMKALEKDRNRRYETANGFAMDVQRYLADEPVQACPPTAGYRLRKSVRRNKRQVIAASLVLFALLAGLAGTAWQAVRAERARADEASQRARAENAYARTADVLDTMVSEVTDDSLASQKTITAEQRRFLTEVLTYYREYAAGGKADDEKARARTARAAFRVGAIEYRLGRKEESAKAFYGARDGYAALVVEFPAVVAYRQELARSHVWLGLLLAGLGKQPEAQGQYRKGLAIFEKLVAEFPAVRAYRQELAGSHTNLGTLLADVEEQGAEEQYRNALAIQEELVVEFPAIPDYRHDLAGSHNNLGLLLAGLGKRPEAQEQYRKGLAIKEKLAAEFPAVPDFRQELAIIHCNLGDLLADLEKQPESQEQYQKGLAIQEKLTADFPTVPAYRQELARSHNSLGILLAALGKRPEAEEQYCNALAIQEELAVEFPTVPAYCRELAASHSNLGLLLAGLGKGLEAEENYREAMAIQEKLAAEFPAVPAYRRDLAASHYNLGRLLGNRPEAEEQYRKALTILERLTAEVPTVPTYGGELAGSHTSLGVLLEALGKGPEAEEHYREAMAILEKLAAEFPAVPAYYVELGGSYCNVGNLVRDGGMPADSLEWFAKAIGVLTPIHEREPFDVTARQYLRNSHWSRAIAHDRLQQFAEAIADWDKVIELSPQEEQPRYRAVRATSRIQTGQVAEAVAEVAELTAPSANATGLAIWNAGQWYDFACVYAIASDKVVDKKDEYARRAVELLQQAVKAGFNDITHMKQDTDLDPLREREDFKKLVAELDEEEAVTLRVMSPCSSRCK